MRKGPGTKSLDPFSLSKKYLTCRAGMLSLQDSQAQEGFSGAEAPGSKPPKGDLRARRLLLHWMQVCP